MNRWFGDSFFFVALLNEPDAAHARAERFLEEFHYLVTTAWVLTEVADGCARPPYRRAAFARLLRLLETSDRVAIIPATQSHFERGLRLYLDRSDKAWSLTDCISFVVMGERGITEALTGDHHFEQAGFTALLK